MEYGIIGLSIGCHLDLKSPSTCTVSTYMDNERYHSSHTTQEKHVTMHVSIFTEYHLPKAHAYLDSYIISVKLAETISLSHHLECLKSYIPGTGTCIYCVI